VRATDGFPVRIRFTKRGKVRFISHRDVARAFERAFRIEDFPLAFTLGFSPRPKVSFGLALSVGHESIAEYLDVELRGPADTGEWPDRLSRALPEGIDVTGAVPLADRAPALQEAVTLVEYQVVVADADGDAVDRDRLSSAVSRGLASDTLLVTRTRKGRESVDDIRPAIVACTLVRNELDADVTGITAQGIAATGDPALELTLSTQSRGARPREVLDALSYDGIVLTERHALRTAQWIERDGARLEPLEADVFARTLEVHA
jgi:radical SAM-linked protein